MEVRATDTFFESLKRLVDSEKWWKPIFWKHKFLDLRRAIINLWIYFPVVTKSVPWDYRPILSMLKFQVQKLADTMEKHSLEVDESRNLKIEKMRRFIELCQNKLNDDYEDRCGYVYRDFDFEEVEDHEGLYRMVSRETPEEEEANAEARKKAIELEEKEWNEMIECLKDMRSWWY